MNGAILVLTLLVQDPARGVGIDQNLGESLPMELRFTDGTGASVAMKELVQDRPAILAFVYYRCPMLCGEILSSLVRTMRALRYEPGREFSLIVVSIAPEEGASLAAQAEKSFLERYGRPGTARFLVGQADAIERLTAAAGFRYRPESRAGEYAHAAALLVLTPEGKVSRYFQGLDYPPKDVRLSLVEAGNGRIGSASDQLLLLCLQYDPATGRYGLAVMRAVRVGGAGTVVVLAAGIFIAIRREKRRRKAAQGP